MVEAKQGNGFVCLRFWAGIVVVLAGCSSPLDRPIGLSDLADPNPTIKVMAIKWAGDNKVSAAVPQMVELLQDEDESVRFYAIEGLRRITGTDNGYDYKAGARRRAEAVERWREFLKSQQSQNQEN